MAKKNAPHTYVRRRQRDREQVPATEFKVSCLRLIDRVQQTREEIVVTKHGRPAAKLVAFDSTLSRSIQEWATEASLVGSDLESLQQIGNSIDNMLVAAEDRVRAWGIAGTRVTSTDEVRYPKRRGTWHSTRIAIRFP